MRPLGSINCGSNREELVTPTLAQHLLALALSAEQFSRVSAESLIQKMKLAYKGL